MAGVSGLITEPGVYDIPADVYHSDPVDGGSLSSTGARRMLPPSCPALFKHWATHTEHKSEFDFGQAAHAEVLGIGRPLHVIDADDWRTKEARNAKVDAYAADEIPVLAKEYAQVTAMAEAIRAHPIASALFDPGAGRGEQTLVWQQHGIWRRAMLDWLPDRGDGRLIVPDYKTCRKADPKSLARAMADYGLHQQGAWNLDGVRQLGLAGDLTPAFLLVFQEKSAPYLVTVAQIDPAALLWGDRLNRSAIDLYRRCVDTDTWPGYGDDEVVSLELPTYTLRQLEDAWLLGDLNPATREALAA